MQHFYQYSNQNLHHDSQQQQEQQHHQQLHIGFNHETTAMMESEPAPMLAKRYLAAIQTNKSNNHNVTSATPTATTTTPSSTNHNKMNVIVSNRRQPNNSTFIKHHFNNNSGNSNCNSNSIHKHTLSPQAPPNMTSIQQNGHQNNALLFDHESNTIIDSSSITLQSQSQIQQPQIITASTIQSRNSNSTSPSSSSRKRLLMRSESFQMRDSMLSQNQGQTSSSRQYEQPQHYESSSLSSSLQQEGNDNGVGRGGGGMSYKRQWTPNQWRNFRTAQQMNDNDNNDNDNNNSQQAQHMNNVKSTQISPTQQQQNINDCGSRPASPETVSANGSNTETDIVTNKTFDLKRRKWLTSSTAANSNNSINGLSFSNAGSGGGCGVGVVQSSFDTMNLPKNKSRKTWVTTSPRNPHRQSKHFQQEPEVHNEECDNDSKDLENGSLSNAINNNINNNVNNNINNNINNSNNPNHSSHPQSQSLPLSPMSIKSKKWQSKILNDRGWIKQSNPNTGTGIGSNGTSNNDDNISNFTHQEGRESPILILPPSMQSKGETFRSSPTGSLKSNSSMKKITSTWMERVNAKTDRRQSQPQSQPLQVVAQRAKQISNHNVEQKSNHDVDEGSTTLLNDGNAKSSLQQSVAVKVGDITNGNNSVKERKQESKPNAFVWGNVKLRRVKEVANEGTSTSTTATTTTINSSSNKMVEDEPPKLISTREVQENDFINEVTVESSFKSIQHHNSMQQKQRQDQQGVDFKVTTQATSKVSVTERIKNLSSEKKSSLKPYASNAFNDNSAISNAFSKFNSSPVRNTPMRKKEQAKFQSSPMRKKEQAKYVKNLSPVRKSDNQIPNKKSFKSNPFIVSSRKDELSVQPKSQPKVQDANLSKDVVVIEKIDVSPTDANEINHVDRVPVSSDSNKINTDVEFQSVRSRLRSWKKKEEAIDSSPSRAVFRPSPERFKKKFDAHQDTERDLKNVPTKKVTVEVPTNSQTCEVVFQKWDQITPKPSQIRRNKLKTFLTEPFRKDSSSEQNFSIKNASSSPFTSSIKELSIDDSKHSGQNIMDTSNPNEDSQDVNIIGEAKKISDISFEFASVKDRIKSLGANIHSNEETTKKNSTEVKQNFVCPSLLEEISSSKDNGDEDDRFSAKNTSRLFHCGIAKKSIEHAKTSCQSEEVFQVKRDEGDNSLKTHNIGLQTPTLEQNQSERRVVKNIKNLFETGTPGSTLISTKVDNNNICLNKGRGNMKTTIQSIPPNKDDEKIINHQSTMDEFTNRLHEESNKQGNNIAQSEKRVKSVVKPEILSTAAFKEIASLEPTKLLSPASTETKSQRSDSPNPTTQLKPERSETLKTSNDEKETFLFTSIKSKFEGIISTTRSKPEIEPVVKSTGMKHTTSRNLMKIESPPNLTKKRNEETNHFRTIEMMQQNEHKKVLDCSPQTDDCQDGRMFETPPPNDIPWQSPGDNPWSTSELNVHRAFAKQKPQFEMNDEIMASYDSCIDDEDCDGVTLSPTTSDVSSLSIPTCLHSVETSTECESSSSSDEDTGAMESGTDKQSSAKGASEASSSHTSEAATPLIHSTLRTMNMSMRLNGNSDTTQSIDAAQVTGLLDAIPPLTEDNFEESLLLQHSQNPLKQRPSNDIDSQTIEEEDCVDLDFSPEWEANFSANNAVEESSNSHSWEGIVGSVGAHDESQHDIDSISCKSSDNCSQVSSVSNKGHSVTSSTTSSQVYRIKKGIKGQPTRTFPSKNPRIVMNNNILRGGPKSLDIHSKQLSNLSLRSLSSDRENKAPPVVTRKQIFKNPSNLNRKSTRRFDVQKVKAHHLARRKSVEKNQNIR